MAEIYKAEEGKYIDSSNIVHNETKLSDILKYSTEEIKVGTDENGKPIYRKSFSGTTFSTGTSAKTVVLMNNIKKIYKAGGVIIISSVKFLIPVSYGDVWVRIGINNNSLILQTDLVEDYSGYDIWVEYTKTTD